jgi:hypothetical protein
MIVDRARWPTAESTVPRVASLVQWRAQVPVDRLPRCVEATASGFLIEGYLPPWIREGPRGFVFLVK